MPQEAIQPNGIKPEMPTEPPQSVKDMTFSFNPDILSGGGESTITDGHGTVIKEEPSVNKLETKEVKEATPVVIPQEKKEVPVLPEKKEAPVKELPVSKETPPVSNKLGIKPVSFGEKRTEQAEPIDYSKYTADEVRELKQMSNQAKVFTARLIDEAKALRQTKENLYLQHEEAYLLDPGFKETQSIIWQAQTEGTAWQNALLAIKAGKPFVHPLGRDPKTGDLIMSKEQQATDLDEIEIARKLNMCENVLAQANATARQYPARYRQQISNDLQAINEVRKQMFAWTSDPSLLEHSIATESGQQTVKSIISTFKNQVPPYMRNHPAVDFAADLMVALAHRTAELEEARKERGVAQVRQNEARRAEPTSENGEVNEGFTQINGHKIPQNFNLDGLLAMNRD